MRRLLLALGLTIAAAPSAYAITFAEWIGLSDNNRMAYVAGMSDGMGWVNVAVQEKHSVSAYCPPRSISFTTMQYTHLLNDYASRHPEPNVDEQEVGLLMLLALQDAFPC